MKKILVIAAHPDDEVLGCGGAIMRLVKEGEEVNITILGEGITSRQEKTSRSEIDKLHKCSVEVAKFLGAKKVFNCDLPDNRFDSVPLLDVIKIVEEFIVRLKPDTIYTHHASYLNIDHVITHRAVLTATRPIADCPVKEIYAFEVPSSTEWTFGQFKPTFHPNIFVDIDDALETKLAAMDMYTSEARFFPHPRSKKALEALARHRGSMVGLQNAEAFELIRSIR